MRRFVIYGDTAFAEEISIIINKEGVNSVVAFTNDQDFITRNTINGIPVYATVELQKAVGEDFEVLIAYGYIQMNNLREKIYNECKSYGWKIGTYVSVNATCFTDSIGEGTIIWPNCYIGPHAKIGKCTIIQASCTLAHDNELGDFNYLAPGVVMGGRSKIQSHCFLGLNSTVKSDACLNDYTLIGSGSNVLGDTVTNGCFFGNPARMQQGNSLQKTI